MIHTLSSSFACLNITGTAPEPVGNPDFYAALPASVKAILAFVMLLGRLENSSPFWSSYPPPFGAPERQV